MMEIFILTFDLSLYYAVILYLLKLIAYVDPSLIGYLFLMAMILAEGIRSAFAPENHVLKYAVLIIPLVSVFLIGNAVQAVLLTPVYLWLIWRMFTGRYDFSYGQFRDLCSKLTPVLFIVYGIFFWLPGYIESVSVCVPYLAMSGLSMICILRYLRQNRTGGVISALMCGALAGVCWLMAYSRFLEKLLKLIKNIYLYLVTGLLHIGEKADLTWMDEIQLPQAGSVEIGGDAMESQAVHTPAVIARLQEMSLLEKILLISVVALIIVLVSLALFSMLKGSKALKRDKETETVEKITSAKKNRLALFAPSDPREAVRWYYAKYLIECQKGGALLEQSTTSRDVAQMEQKLLSEKESDQLRSLYIVSRYSSKPVSKQDAAAVKSLYKQAKNIRRQGSTL